VVYRTDQDGLITVLSDGYRLHVELLLLRQNLQVPRQLEQIVLEAAVDLDESE